MGTGDIRGNRWTYTYFEDRKFTSRYGNFKKFLALFSNEFLVKRKGKRVCNKKNCCTFKCAEIGNTSQYSDTKTQIKRERVRFGA